MFIKNKVIINYFIILNIILYLKNLDLNKYLILYFLNLFKLTER